MPPGALSSPLLAALSPSERSRLLARAVFRWLPSGAVLHLTGDRREWVHVVAAGIVKLSARDADGNETILGLALPGDLVGDAAVIDGLPQPTDALTATRCEICSLDAEVLRAVLAANPAAALTAARGLAARLRWVGEAALERSSGDLSAKLAGRLLDLALRLGRSERGAIEVDLPLGQADLAKLAGMCRESACKTLRGFKSEGLVDYETRGRRLRILRPDLLERVKHEGAAAREKPPRSSSRCSPAPPKKQK